MEVSSKKETLGTMEGMETSMIDFLELPLYSESSVMPSFRL